MGIRELTEGTGRLENSRNEVIGKGEQGVGAPEHAPWRGWLEPIYSTAIARGSWMPFAGHCWQHLWGSPDSLCHFLQSKILGDHSIHWGLVPHPSCSCHGLGKTTVHIRIWSFHGERAFYQPPRVTRWWIPEPQDHRKGVLMMRKKKKKRWKGRQETSKANVCMAGGEGGMAQALI